MDYSASILRVDLERERATIEKIDSPVLRWCIGGVGLGARVLWQETSATTDPFSPDNRLMFLIGPLTGIVPQSSRTAVCALSPLSNAWGEATIGGTWGAEFRNTGFGGIVISGRAKKPVYLYIKDSEARVQDASHLWGKDTFEVNDTLPERFLTKFSELNEGEQNRFASGKEFEKRLQEYYAVRGWSREGIPTPRKLDELGLD